MVFFDKLSRYADVIKLGLTKDEAKKLDELDGKKDNKYEGRSLFDVVSEYKEKYDNGDNKNIFGKNISLYDYICEKLVGTISFTLPEVNINWGEQSSTANEIADNLVEAIFRVGTGDLDAAIGQIKSTNIIDVLSLYQETANKKNSVAGIKFDKETNSYKIHILGVHILTLDEKNELLKLKKELEDWENRLNATDAELKKQQSEIDKKIETTAKKLLEEKLSEMFGKVRSTREKRFEVFCNQYKLSDGKTITEKFLEGEAELIKKIGEKEYNSLGVNRSEYTCFYFPYTPLMNHVLSQLDKKNIPYIENDLGFEIENKFIDIVNSLENSYTEEYHQSYEDTKRLIDILSLRSKDLNDFFEKLEKNHYKIKREGYGSVCPEDSEIFIRLDSLGPSYSELALDNRISGNQNFENKYTKKLENISENNRLEYNTVKSIGLLMTAIKAQRYHFNKKHSNGIVAWVNNAELDKLSLLNKMINEGTTIDTLKQNFSDANEAVKKYEKELDDEKRLLDYYNTLKEKIEVVFKGKPAPESKIQEYKKELNSFEDFTITAYNYTGIYKVIDDEEKTINEIEKNLKEKRNLLEEAAEYYSLANKVMDGTYVQSLCNDEKNQKEHRYVPHRSHGGMSR